MAQGIAIAFFRNIHNPRAEFTGDVLRAVGAAVVGDEDFAFDSRRGESALRGGDAIGQRLRLVQAGHDDGDFRHGWACGGSFKKTRQKWLAISNRCHGAECDHKAIAV